MLGAGVLTHFTASAWECWKCVDEECTQTETEEWGRQYCVDPPEWTACSLGGAKCMFIEQ
jgi:hypothetical protein